jgi:hypothetical protein
MVMARAFLSLLAGFAVMVAIMLVVTALLKRFAPEWVEPEQKPRPGYVFVNLGCPFLAAACGGYITAWAAAVNVLPDLLGLAIVVLVLGAISVMQARVSEGQARGSHPIWYRLMLVVISPLGVIAGGLVRLRVVGIL